MTPFADWNLVEGGVLVGIGVVLQSLAAFVRERWKGSNARTELAIRADQQEADQAKALAPIWQSIVDQQQAQITELRGEVKDLQREQKTMLEAQHGQAIQLARHEERVSSLTAQLEQATRRHDADAERITTLTATLAAAQEQLEDTRADLIRMARDRDRYRQLWHQSAPGETDAGPFVPDDWRSEIAQGEAK